jgi:PAS domain-containing protein
MGSLESAEPSRFFAKFAAFVALAVGLFVLAGWAFDMDQLTNIVPSWPQMVRLTAISFVISGLALWLATIDVRTPAITAAALLALVGLLILVRNVSGWNAYLEQLTLAPRPAAIDGGAPARMAPATALNFTLLGLSLLLAQRPRAALLHQALATCVLLVGWLGLSRYVFGGEPMFSFTNMAVHTAILFVLLSIGALSLRPDAGVARLLASSGVGGSMARRLFPAAIVVPLLAGALTLHFERRGIFGFEAAVSVFALSSVIVFMAFVWINAARGERADTLRRDAERALRLSEERNQLIVETALDGVISINAQGLITGWNTQAEKMFGWTRQQAIPKTCATSIAAACGATWNPVSGACSTSGWR